MNKKLLKSILCIASGVAIATSIPFATTSCGSSSSEEEINALPEEVYDIDETNSILKGFSQDFLDNQTAYSEYDTILIPDRITSIGESAFENASATTIPWFISHIKFTKNSNCVSVGYRAFINNTSITSLSLPNKLTEIKSNGFKSLLMLSSIVWDGWQGPSKTTVLQDAFLYAGDIVTDRPLILKVTNPVGGNDSQALLNYLKQSSRSLPESWEVGK